jgi:hypothetical protein
MIAGLHALMDGILKIERWKHENHIANRYACICVDEPLGDPDFIGSSSGRLKTVEKLYDHQNQ